MWKGRGGGENVAVGHGKGENRGQKTVWALVLAPGIRMLARSITKLQRSQKKFCNRRFRKKKSWIAYGFWFGDPSLFRCPSCEKRAVVGL